MIKQLKLFLAHILIFTISIFYYTHMYEYVEYESREILCTGFHFILISSLYILSGYYITEKTEKFQLKSYWIVAIIGIFIWLFAFISSPTDLDWKNGHGGNWLFYRLYISGIEVLFYFSEYTRRYEVHIVVKQLILLTVSIIPSALQAFGGYLKHKKR